MYKYERRKNFFESKPYSFDYSQIYDSNRSYSKTGEERRFFPLEKGGQHLEKPNRGKARRFSESKKTENFCYLEKKHSNANIFTGLLRFTVACIILTAFLLTFAIAVSIFDKGDEAWSLKKYDDIIWPVVMQDPHPFDENRPLDRETMLRACLWELAMNRKDMSNAWNEEQQLVLPKSEVESAGKKLFGKEVDFSGLDCSDPCFYKFDDTKNEFLVEPVSGTNGFLPHTVNACHEGNDVILKVGYVSPKNQFNSEMNKVFENKVEKYAKYRLKKDTNTGDFYILSVT